MESKNGRIEYIDIARALAIVLVAVGHALPDGKLRMMIYSFHVPVFFLISGLLVKPLASYDSKSVKELILRKIKVYYMPYFIWAMIYAPNYPFTLKNMGLILYGTRESIYQAGSMSALWFMPVLFLASLMMDVVEWLGTRFKRPVLFKIFVMIAATAVGMSLETGYKLSFPFAFERSLVALGFIILGSIAADTLKRASEGELKVLCVKFAVIAVIFAVCTLLVPGDEKVMMCINRYRNIPFFIATSITGSAALLTLSMVIAKLNFNKKLILYIGTSTLGILLIHKSVMQVIEDVLTRFGINAEGTLVSVLYSIPLIAVTLVIVRFFDFFCPTVIGKKGKL